MSSVTCNVLVKDAIIQLLFDLNSDDGLKSVPQSDVPASAPMVMLSVDISVVEVTHYLDSIKKN